MYKKVSALLLILAILVVPAIASAHVIVTPGQAGVGEELTFSISVPNEQESSVVNVKLAIPSGVMEVTPTEKSGWKITTTKDGSSDESEITAITWSGGSIPVGQRADFSFSAQVPATATELDWKAFQTYADGSVIHWDQKPAGSDDATGNAGPYSVTKVVNDLAESSSSTTKTSNTTLPLILSILAIVVSVFGLVARKRA